MGSKKIDFKTLVDDFITQGNKALKELKEDIILGIAITTKGKQKKLVYYSVDSNNWRTVLFEKVFEVDNPAEFLKQDINYILYRELFYNCFVFHGIQMTSIIKEQEMNKAVDNITPGVKETSSKSDPVMKAIKNDE